MILFFQCISCGRKYQSDTLLYQCKDCSESDPRGFRKGNLIIETASPTGITPGRPVDPHSFLPIPIKSPGIFPAGNSPLIKPEGLSSSFEGESLYLKLEHTNPSGSLKDRASLLVAEYIRQAGLSCAVLASTGNAGSAMACAGAAYGFATVLFVPATAPKAKILQSLLYGALVIPVEGSYDDAFLLSIAFTDRYGGVNRNTAYNPLTVEGKKTAAIEIYNQLNGDIPDYVYIPGGDGVIYSGVFTGFFNLLQAGLIKSLPKLVLVQAMGSNAIAQSWLTGKEVILDRTETIADSLAVRSPAAGEMTLKYLGESGGHPVEVSDGQIQDAQLLLCRKAGIFVEPSSAAALAGFAADKKNRSYGAKSVVLLTGSGFKNIAAAEALINLPPACSPRIEDAVRHLKTVYPDQRVIK